MSDSSLVCPIVSLVSPSTTSLTSCLSPRTLRTSMKWSFQEWLRLRKEATLLICIWRRSKKSLRIWRPLSRALDQLETLWISVRLMIRHRLSCKSLTTYLSDRLRAQSVSQQEEVVESRPLSVLPYQVPSCTASATSLWQHPVQRTCPQSSSSYSRALMHLTTVSIQIMISYSRPTLISITQSFGSISSRIIVKLFNTSSHKTMHSWPKLSFSLSMRQLRSLSLSSSKCSVHTWLFSPLLFMAMKAQEGVFPSNCFRASESRIK